MEIPESLKQEIERRRSADVAYQLLTDEEIATEIKEEELAKDKANIRKAQDKKLSSPSYKSTGDCFQSQLISWKVFYEEIWEIQQQRFVDIPIPKRHKDFNWLIVMLKGMTASKIIRKMKEHMDVDNDNLLGLRSVRKPTKDYAILVRDRIEADQEFKNKSAEELKEQEINCITLEERLMLELFYFWKTKKHLDHNNYTLCAGSRYSDGSVPYVHWVSSDSRVYVFWYSADDRDPGIRARAVVS